MNYYPLPCHNLSRCRQDQIQKIATTKTWEKGTNFSVLGVSRDEWSVNSITFAYSTKKTIATSARQQKQKRLLLTKKVIGSQLLLTIPHFADPPCHPRPSPYLQIKNKKKEEPSPGFWLLLVCIGGGREGFAPICLRAILVLPIIQIRQSTLTYYFDSRCANMLKNLTRIET